MKHLPYIIALLLLPLMAGAQGYSVRDNAGVETAISNTMWFNSSNAAGLAWYPLPSFNTVGFGYQAATGDFHRVREGQGTGDLSFDTQGSLPVGGIQLWGHFRYDNIGVHDALANTMLYDPYDEREVFSVADAVSSSWKRQAYDMEFKAATRLGDGWAAGLHLHYVDRIGAKQNDPRSETYKYSIDVRPGIVYWQGGNIFGLSAIYSNMFERSVPTLSNTSEIQAVYVMRGMGNFTLDQVGSNGLQTLFWRCNSFGAALQYARGESLLAELSAVKHTTDATESATNPYRLGSTAMLEISASLQMAFGSGRLTAGAEYRKTDGTEYSQVHNLSTGEYEVVTSAVTSGYSTARAHAAYDHYIGGDSQDLYVWKFGARTSFEHKFDEYILPHTEFSYDNLLMCADASRRWTAGNKLLRLGAEAGYNLNLGGEYSYSGSFASDTPASVWYPHDNAILTSNYFMGGAIADISLPLSGGLSLSVSGEVRELISSANGRRTVAFLGVGLIF